ncbi:hypothetical protein ACFLV0_03160 [Chloroflexota bacterium]
MENIGISEQKLNFVCFRCGCKIKVGENMVSMSISMETPTQDDSIKHIESAAVSTLCFPCASILLSESIVADKQMMMPPAQEIEEEEEEYDEEISVSGDEDEDTRARLRVQSSSKGFRLILDCGDGISKATSQFFTWKQIVQMLISADPDMFGVLSEPLHWVFPGALERFGLHVPGWRDLQDGNNLNSFRGGC